jgi:hypothetical protein
LSFLDGHRGDLSRSRFINAKQNFTLQTRWWVCSRRRAVLHSAVPKPQLLLGSVDMRVVSPGKPGYVSPTPPTSQAMDGQNGAIIFLWAPWAVGQ